MVIDMSKGGMRKRLEASEVGYMELPIKNTSGFGCGRCVFFKLGFCHNGKVAASVSGEHGCCNLFRPGGYSPVPSTKWEALNG